MELRLTNYKVIIILKPLPSRLQSVGVKAKELGNGRFVDQPVTLEGEDNLAAGDHIVQQNNIRIDI
jgi:hypothetical protein